MNQDFDKRLAVRVSGKNSFSNESAVVEIFKRIFDLRSQGKKIINMTLGELEFDTPEHIQLAAFQGILQGKTRYTQVGGSDEFIRAIQNKLNIDNHLFYETSEIMAGTGSKQLIFNAMMATVDEGDEVIITAPYWNAYPKIIRLANGTVMAVMTEVQNGYKVTPALLSSALTSRSKWLILNSPGNPSGAVYTRHELSELAAVLADHPDILILSDEVYEFQNYDVPFISFAEAVPHMKERTLTVNGLSKSYAMTGWRIGYAAGPEWLINGMKKIQESSTSHPSSISQAAATSALNGDKSFMEAWRNSLINCRDIACDILVKSPFLRFQKPKGALYIFVDYRLALCAKNRDQVSIIDDYDVVKYLLEEAGVIVLPGAVFGMAGHVRLTFSIGCKDVICACQAIVKAIGFYRLSLLNRHE